MQANPLSLSFILSANTRFVAPLFQRPYVWERESNWMPLWETIQDVAEQQLSGVMPRPRFLGAIVLDQMQVPVGSIMAREIIDGQQRLTTLQIFLAVARDLYREICDEKGYTPNLLLALQQLTTNNPPYLLPEEQFKVWPTNSDREHFQRVMTAGNPAQLAIAYGATPQWQKAGKSYILGKSSDPKVQEVLNKWDAWSAEEQDAQMAQLSTAQLQEIKNQFTAYNKAKHRMVYAHWYFWCALSQWLDSPDELTFARKMQALLATVQNSLILVVIDLGPGDDAQQIFETLNAQGMPLSPADLVKNFLFREAELVGESLEPLHQAYWEHFDADEAWWREEISQGRFMLQRLDAFLWHYLTLTLRRDVHSADIFTTFRDWARSSASILTPAQQLQRFHDYAKIYKSFESDSQPERIQVFFERLNVLQASTVYPLLLDLFKRLEYRKVDLEEILVDIESYLVRRLIVGLTTKNYNRFFLDLLQSIERSTTPASQTVKAFLLAAQGESVRWPTDVDLKHAFLTRPLYGGMNQPRLAMVLLALDTHLHTVKGEDFTLQSKLTIEHLMPVSWGANWPLPTSIDEEQAIERRENLLHTLGNLTLISGKLNSSISNAAWESTGGVSKRLEIGRHSSMALNRNLPTIWDEDAIEARSLHLFQHAIAIWPHPGAATQTATP